MHQYKNNFARRQECFDCKERRPEAIKWNLTLYYRIIFLIWKKMMEITEEVYNTNAAAKMTCVSVAYNSFHTDGSYR